eukprot:2858443-Pyramimonas_sp.AAC.1
MVVLEEVAVVFDVSVVDDSDAEDVTEVVVSVLLDDMVVLEDSDVVLAVEENVFVTVDSVV